MNQQEIQIVKEFEAKLKEAQERIFFSGNCAKLGIARINKPGNWRNIDHYFWLHQNISNCYLPSSISKVTGRVTSERPGVFVAPVPYCELAGTIFYDFCDTCHNGRAMPESQECRICLRNIRRNYGD